MLRFFRSIRQSLISEGKTVKYMKYAVGEFLLIVAGILVALQIQTWNENRKLEQDRQELIENLKVDFGLTLDRIDQALERMSSIVSGYELFLKAVGSESTEIGITEIIQGADDGFQAFTFQPVLGSLESAQSTGTISLIQSATFINLIAGFQRRFIIFQDLSDIFREQQFLQSRGGLRRKLGSTRGTVEYSPHFNPPRYALSGEEFWKVVTDKEVYGAFETFHHTRNAQKSLLNGLRETTEQILAALEALE